jgi:hypothetical protein
MNKNKLSFFHLTGLLILVFSFKLNAQGIKRSTICSFGSSSVINGQTLRQSVGQPSNTTTSSTPNLTLRQGFQQPSNNSGQSKAVSECNISVYPNPSKADKVSFLTDSLPDSKLKISVFNAQGAIVYSFNSFSTQNSMDLSLLASGLYTVFAKSSNAETCSTKLIIVR